MFFDVQRKHLKLTTK